MFPRLTSFILRLRVRRDFQSLHAHYTSIWDYGYRDLDCLEIGKDVTVGPFVEIVVQRKSRFSQIEGRLILGDRVVLGTGTNVRAAGGVIQIGHDTNVSQHCALIASNHVMDTERGHTGGLWDQVRTGVTIGHHVWVGANSVLLPGSVIGDYSVIAAGAVVRGTVPPKQLWGGVPARRIRDL